MINNQISIDNLTERISVVFSRTSRNERGDIVKEAEITRCEIWAMILPLTGRIADAQPERLNSVTYRITIRYRADILPDDEIIWRGRRFKMRTPPIDLENRHRWTQFNCEEVIQDGKA